MLLWNRGGCGGPQGIRITSTLTISVNVTFTLGGGERGQCCLRERKLPIRLTAPEPIMFTTIVKAWPRGWGGEGMSNIASGKAGGLWHTCGHHYQFHTHYHCDCHCPPGGQGVRDPPCGKTKLSTNLIVLVPVTIGVTVSVVVTVVRVMFWVDCRTWYSCSKYGCRMAHWMSISLNLTEKNGP